MYSQGYRSHYSSELINIQANTSVTIAGFIDTKRDHGGLLFIDLRDPKGLIQCVFEHNTPAFSVIDNCSKESVVMIEGVLAKRSPQTLNPNLETGAIEVIVKTCTLLSAAKNELPFDNNGNISDVLKLKHRYLYLRSPQMQKKLKLRSQFIEFLRNKMSELNFMEVQTPILTASSPEGARDYLIPSYEHKGKFYALPQAPQQFKQILMASGVDKYYQIAPCFRAEASRADRSPGEFYQLDFEISFGTEKQVFDVCEQVIGQAFEKFFKGSVNQAPYPIFSYKQALEQFCSDKPDLRNPLRYQTISFDDNVPAIFANIQTTHFTAKILPISSLQLQSPHEGSLFSRKQLDQLQEYVKEQGLGGLAYAKYDDSVWSGPGAKIIPGLENIKADFVFLLAGPEPLVNKIGANLRNHIYFDILQCKADDQALFCWVNDYPMYELDEGKVVFSHNPFSMPKLGVQALEEINPVDIIAYQYDLVCNGIEICSGAVRNHDPKALIKAFKIAGYDEKQIKQTFSAMISAFECGVPPHAGAAPGVDRMIMILANEHNIREVIAFPLSQNAEDLLMGAPSEPDLSTLKALGLKVI